MRHTRRRCLQLMVAGVAGLLTAGWLSLVTAAEAQIDFERARQLLLKERRGEVLTPQEQQYLQEAREARQRMAKKGRPPPTCASCKRLVQLQIRPDGLLLDFNQPLAGETLCFHVKIADLRPATSEELAHGHPHSAGHKDQAGRSVRVQQHSATIVQDYGRKSR